MNPIVDLKLKESSETFTIMNYFSAINYVIRMSDAESTYFALFSLLNFITNLEFINELDRPQMSQRELIAKMTMHQMDYQTLCACLIKSQLLHQILILP